MNKTTVTVAAGMLMAAALARGGEIKHRFLASDFMHCSVHCVDQTDASKNWSLKLPEIAFDLQLVGGNRLLCNRSKGYDIYDLATRQKVDSFQSDALKDVRSVRRLADGRTFLGTQGGTVYEYDAQKTSAPFLEKRSKKLSIRLVQSLCGEGNANG